MDSTLIATVITVFVSVTGGLLWVSYKHPKAYAKLIVPPAIVGAAIGIVAIFAGVLALVFAHFQVADMLPEVEAQQEPLSKGKSFVGFVSGMISAQRLIGLGIMGIALVAFYFWVIDYIGVTLRDSAKDDDSAQDVPAQPRTDPE